MKITLASAFSVAAAVALLGASAVPAEAQPASGSGIYKNCTALHTKYPHGVGRSNAHDHTSGKPVTNFTHNTAAYNAAVKANANLDRDRDGIACESA